MSGHSKWSTIKRKKGANDAKRGALFTKIIKEITVAARAGGGELDSNPRLRTAVNKAKANNMPNDNIDRAIKKGTGDLDGVTYEEVRYEGYGPGGVAIMIDALTDNKNRTTPEIRTIFNKNNGNLGESGSVAYLFERKGQIVIDPDQTDEESLMELLIEYDVEDIKPQDDGSIEITTAPDAYNEISEAIAEEKLATSINEVTQIPTTTIALDEKKAEQLLRLLDLIDEHEDVQSVYSNEDIDDELMESLSQQ